MKFFLPGATSEAEIERVYVEIKNHMARELDADISPRRIQSLEYFHNGKSHSDVVGKEESGGLGIVVAIFFDTSRSLYLVCTPDRGVIGGFPILVGEHDVRAFVDFDSA